MKIDFDFNTKYKIKYSSSFKKSYGKIKNQDREIDELKIIINKLANKELLDVKYKDHALYDDKRFKNCRDCHIKPDLVLIYKYMDDELVLLLVNIGSHSKLNI